MEKRKRSRSAASTCTGTIVFLVVACAPISLLAQSYTFTQIAALGGSTPFVSYFEPGAITNFGQVVFGPDLNTGGEGVFLWRGGQLTAIAKGGQTMADGGVLGYTLSPMSANLWGDVAFIMTRNGTGDVPPPLGLNAGVYRYNPLTGVVPVMIPGQQAPGGGAFWGSSFIAAVNNLRNIVFPGMVCTTANNSAPYPVPCPDGSPGVLALGVYQADLRGRISSVVKPGDPAPGGTGSTFDLAYGTGLKDFGDVAFTENILGEQCANASAGTLFCADSLYVKRAATGKIESIAHHGDPSPVPGKNYFSSFGPVLNWAGDVSFTSDLSVQGDGSDVAVFLYTTGKTIVIAKSGDAMPGGGILATGGFYAHNAYMNNRLGTISTLDDFGGGKANTQIALNDAGQILFAARFQEGGGALLVATPGK